MIERQGNMIDIGFHQVLNPLYPKLTKVFIVGGREYTNRNGLRSLIIICRYCINEKIEDIEAEVIGANDELIDEVMLKLKNMEFKMKYDRNISR